MERLSFLQAVLSIQTDPYPHACVEHTLADPLSQELEIASVEKWMLEQFYRLSQPIRRLDKAMGRQLPS